MQESRPRTRGGRALLFIFASTRYALVTDWGAIYPLLPLAPFPSTHNASLAQAESLWPSWRTSRPCLAISAVSLKARSLGDHWPGRVEHTLRRAGLRREEGRYCIVSGLSLPSPLLPSAQSVLLPFGRI
jgi:hypothetical protein